MVNNEEYNLLVDFLEWLRSQDEVELELKHSEEVVGDFLDSEETLH
jgi:hypothetical protein